MLKMFQYLKAVKKHVFFIVVCLCVQAWCDLSLPQYTSDMVDVGIMQGGIEYAVPEYIRTDTLHELLEVLEPEVAADLEKAYVPYEDKVMKLKVKNKEKLKKLAKEVSRPFLLLSMKGQPEEQINRILEQPESTIHQAAILCVSKEQEAAGIDGDKIRMNYLLLTGGKMLAMTLLMVGAAVFAGLLASQAAAHVGKALRREVFGKVMSFSSHEMEHFSTASLITRTTNDIQQIQTVMVMLLRVVMYAPIIGIGGIVKVASTRTGLGWIIGVAVGSSLALVMILMSFAMPRFKMIQQLIDKMNLVSREFLTGIHVIRAFSREKHEEKRFDDASSQLMKTQLFTNRIMNCMMPLMMLIMGIVTVLIVWFGGHGIQSGTMQVGDMIAFITYTMQIVMAFLMIAMISIMLPRAGVAAARINEVLGTTAEIKDVKEKGKDMTSAKGELCFDHVCFQYPDAGENVLEDICFTAKPGETTAIIGSTGSGKSTLLNLIPRFYDVTKGQITIDGCNIKDIAIRELRDLLGYVPQKGILFSGTIASNIRFGGENMTEEEVLEAARIAQASEFIEEKPEAYNSPVSQGGNNVSGGQKQRLSIARAIVRKPKILLFDDSFSALDYKTDAVLRKELNKTTKDAVVIIVAQRISTIMHADQILVLDDGRIVGQGTHKELLQNCSTYREIAMSQLSEKEMGGADR